MVAGGTASTLTTSSFLPSGASPGRSGSQSQRHRQRQRKTKTKAPPGRSGSQSQRQRQRKRQRQRQRHPLAGQAHNHKDKDKDKEKDKDKDKGTPWQVRLTIIITLCTYRSGSVRNHRKKIVSSNNKTGEGCLRFYQSDRQ